MNINDVSKLTGISKDMIRFYEKKGIIHPTRKENNYRDYTMQDSDLIVLAKQYSLMGIDLDTIANIFHDNDLTQAKEQLQLSIKKFQQDLIWTQARITNTQDFASIFQMIDEDIDYRIIEKDPIYFYPMDQNHALVTEAYQYGSIAKAVFRIRYENHISDQYPNDTGLLLSQPLQNPTLKYKKYPERTVYRGILYTLSNHFLTSSDISQLDERILALGYQCIGDVFIYEVIRHVDEQPHSIVCVEVPIERIA